VTATTDPRMVPVIAERDRLRTENRRLRDAAQKVLDDFGTVGFEEDSEQLRALCDLRDVLAALDGTPSEDARRSRPA
jgi:hypothetical protein